MGSVKKYDIDKLIGKKFGYWTIISFSHIDSNYMKYFNCVCKCGTKWKVRLNNLMEGRSFSCGCHRNY